MIIYLHDLVILFLITIFFFNIIKVWIVLMVYVSTNFKKFKNYFRDRFDIFGGGKSLKIPKG
jgi:hypothetical protein